MSGIVLLSPHFLQLTPVTFATLPNPVPGLIAHISDSQTATWGDVVTGGGFNQILVWYNGTNWKVLGA